MSKRNYKSGRRLYQCDECKARSVHHWIERDRAARMRCPACGSIRLELVSEEVKEEQVAPNRVRIAGHPDMTYPPGHSRKKTT